MVFEVVERSDPQSAVGGQPLVNLGEWFETQPVHASLGVGPDLDESGVAKDAQVLGDRRLAQAEPVDELADGPLAGAQKVEDVPASGLGQNREAHPRSMPDQLYAGQDIYLRCERLRPRASKRGPRSSFLRVLSAGRGREVAPEAEGRAVEPADREWLKQRALNVVGHELRTPASTIRGLAEVLVAEDDPGKRAELMTALLRNARRLEVLLDDLLAAAGVTTALPVGPPEAIDLPEAIRDTRGGADPGIEISGTGVVRARRTSVSRIVGAILDNARAYGEPPLRITVRSGTDRTIAVLDSPGPQLPSEDVRYALEPFWRGERAVTRRPGLGVGLSVAATLATHEGGRLWVEGRDQGGLVTFLELPAA